MAPNTQQQAHSGSPDEPQTHSPYEPCYTGSVVADPFALKARDAYYAERLRWMKEQHADWTKPVVQAECDVAGWNAVVAFIRNLVDREWAGRLFKQMEGECQSPIEKR